MFGYGPYYGFGYGPYGVGGYNAGSWGCCSPGYGTFCRNRYDRGYGFGYGPYQNYYAGFSPFTPYGFY